VAKEMTSAYMDPASQVVRDVVGDYADRVG